MGGIKAKVGARRGSECQVTRGERGGGGETGEREREEDAVREKERGGRGERQRVRERERGKEKRTKAPHLSGADIAKRPHQPFGGMKQH